MIRKLAFCLLLGCVLSAACSGHGPTGPDTPPVATPPPEPPPATEPPPPQPPPAPPPTITRTRFLAFGDSITAGTTAPVFTTKMSAGLPESYPFKLQTLLADRYVAQTIAVENAGFPLEQAADGVRRLPGLLRSIAPEIVILLEGANDLTGPSVVNRTLAAMNTMARDARVAGATVVLCTLPPQRAGGLRANDPTAVANYNTGIRDIARGEGAILVDLSREMDLSLIGADGLHPTEAGYAQMAQIFFVLFQDRYERSGVSGE